MEAFPVVSNNVKEDEETAFIAEEEKKKEVTFTANTTSTTQKSKNFSNSMLKNSIVWVPRQETNDHGGEEMNYSTAPFLSKSNRSLSASVVLEHKSSVLGVTEEEDETADNSKLDSISPPMVSYELFMWTWFLILSFLAIYDRFDWNVWPRQNFTIGKGSAGSDRLVGYKEGPWSVVLYDVIARISGRYSIVCYNFLLLTRMESLEDFLSSGSFISKYVLDCSNMVNANIRLHMYNGIALCVLTLLHVWSILFPCIFHGYSVKVIPGQFEWFLSERNPTKCKVEQFDGCWPGDANAELEQMGLQVDDVFRMVEMTVFLAILMPLSLKWLSTHWHAAIQLHRFINIVYFVDIGTYHFIQERLKVSFLDFPFDSFPFIFLCKHPNCTKISKSNANLPRNYVMIYTSTKTLSSSFLGPQHPHVCSLLDRQDSLQ